MTSNPVQTGRNQEAMNTREALRELLDALARPAIIDAIQNAPKLNIFDMNALLYAIENAESALSHEHPS